MGMLKSQEIILPLRPISKPRPRSFMGQRRPYNDPIYKRWIEKAKAHMSEFWMKKPLDYVTNLNVTFMGPARGDLDNRLGAVLDAGNEILWKDDNVKVIGCVTMKWFRTKEKEAHIVLNLVWEEDL
tara:strand:- start:4213 stop:4590 length:378 start_codon:yes stop_codon:yes gene_type:complete